jgi:hypothetical protein
MYLVLKYLVFSLISKKKYSSSKMVGNLFGGQ